MTIVDFQREHEYSPTLRELAEIFGVSANTVYRHLEALQKKGYLERDRDKARAINIVRLP